ncbi:MAG TPA: pitrilysin family protein [Bryobacteraceae bacterium]|nr:pitrilysin family protein [Bryobacteraceae bacterium]
MKRLTFALTIASFMVAAKEAPPQGTAPRPFHLPKTDDFVLPNGMQVTIVPYGIVPKVTILAFIDAGALYEPSGQVWMSKLTAKLLKEGAGKRSAEALASDVADMGGQLDTGADADYAVAGGDVLSDAGPRFIALLADVLKNPTLPESELKRLKADLARDLAVAKSSPQSLARERFLETVFPDHPYGRVFPSDAALAGYTIDQVKAFYNANYAAARTHLYVAGRLDPGLRDAIRASFADWKKGAAPDEKSPAGVKARSLQVIDRPGAAQSTLYMGLPVAAPASADYIPEDVMNQLLGGSFASRITTNIREQKGYTYSPRSVIGTRGRTAYWVEQADVTTAVTGPSLKEIFGEIDRLRKEAPTKPELSGIQTYMSGIFVLSNTVSPNAVINQLHFVDSQKLDRSWLSTYVQKVNEVKPEDIQRLAETELVPSKMTIVVVGDTAKIGDQLKPYQTTE